jgi:hypothetical protein
MAWNTLGTQFCLELAFGLALALCTIARAPLGKFFWLLMGTTLLLPLLVVLIALPKFGGGTTNDPELWLVGLAALAFPFTSGPVRARRRLFALCWSTACIGAALVFALNRAPGPLDGLGAGTMLLCAASAMATGTVAGGVGLAMVVGHWYLTVPQLSLSWITRLNRFTAGAMIVSALLLALTMAAFHESLSSGRAPLSAPWGMMQISARVAVGLLLPLLFAWMTAGSLAYRNTRSATGILYASTVLVLIGTAVSVSLQNTYGIPL